MIGLRVGLITILVWLAGCSVGGHYTPEGPHPHFVWASAIHAGPIEVMHTAVSNSKPVTDLTAATVNAGPSFGRWQLSLGTGWQFSRTWGACDENGYHCAHHWTDGWVAAAGVRYRTGAYRADLRLFSYDNSPVGAETNLPLNVEAIVLLMGFDW